jgi:response regulator RpfG family c-di-GMP phosphodiesterase
MKRRILLVDDDVILLESLERALSDDPFEVILASSAKQALSILAHREDVDVVVSDEKMPGMSGNSLLARVYEEYPRTLRIMLTGHGSVDSALKAIHDGWVFKYLLKPCKPDDLVAVINQGLLKRTLSDDKWQLLISPEDQDDLLLTLSEPQQSETGAPDWTVIGNQTKKRGVRSFLRSWAKAFQPELMGSHPGTEEETVPAEASELKADMERLFESGEDDQALPVARQCLLVLEDKLGLEHEQSLKTTWALGTLLADFGDFQEAKKILHRCLEKQESKLGQEHSSIALTQCALAHVYQRKGDLDQAKHSLQKALGIQEQALAPDSMELAKTLGLLANLYLATGESGKAAKYFERSQRAFDLALKKS